MAVWAGVGVRNQPRLFTPTPAPLRAFFVHPYNLAQRRKNRDWMSSGMLDLQTADLPIADYGKSVPTPAAPVKCNEQNNMPTRPIIRG